MEKEGQKCNMQAIITFYIVSSGYLTFKIIRIFLLLIDKTKLREIATVNRVIYFMNEEEGTKVKNARNYNGHLETLYGNTTRCLSAIVVR